MDNIREKWEEIKEIVKREYNLSGISFSTWVEPLKLFKIEEDVVYIIIPSDQAQALSYITSKYKSFFQVTISEMYDHIYEVDFILESDIPSEDSLEDDSSYYMETGNGNATCLLYTSDAADE